MSERLTDAARRVQSAIQVKGRMPAYHDRIVGQLRWNWPTLWTALVDLIAALEEEEKSSGFTTFAGGSPTQWLRWWRG